MSQKIPLLRTPMAWLVSRIDWRLFVEKHIVLKTRDTEVRGSDGRCDDSSDRSDEQHSGGRRRSIHASLIAKRRDPSEVLRQAAEFSADYFECGRTHWQGRHLCRLAYQDRKR